ncbi:MAG: alkaline phosphatase family protein [Anaerolineaceae bacterium]|nr:alkaline phosphatase family protein [Anaerolineaceae bacterium]
MKNQTDNQLNNQDKTPSSSLKKSRLWSAIVVFVLNVLTLFILGRWLKGVQIQSLGGALALMVACALVIVVYYWLFMVVLTRLPYWLFPLLSAILVGGLLYGTANFIPGIDIADFNSGIILLLVLVGVNTLLGIYFAYDIDDEFNLKTIKHIIGKKAAIQESDEPGILFIEIDGLSGRMMREAIKRGSLPTVKKLLDSGKFKLEGWETDYSSQTGAIQSGILLGSNSEIPAYRWWDRENGKMMRSGSFKDAFEIEKAHSTDEGLLKDGASRGNMFSGDASETMLTVSTILDIGKRSGPGFYVYLLNPFIFGRLLSKFLYGVLREWAQNIAQRIRGDKFRVKSRNIFYAFTRAATCQVMQDVITFLVIGDVLRGLPAIYMTFPGYDDVAHYTGVDSRETFQTLEEMDRFFGRILRALEETPRPYKVVFLSDHGQTAGGTFENAWGLSFDKLVRNAVSHPVDIFTNLEVSEAWEKWQAALVEEQNQIEHKIKQLVPLRILLRTNHKKASDQLVKTRDSSDSLTADDSRQQLAVFSSGCSGLVYFTDAKVRLSLEELQERTPNLVYNILDHPGVGFVVVRSETDGNIVLGKLGAYYLDKDEIDGENPLANFSANAPALLKRLCHYQNAPDLLVSTVYDPENKTMPAFENQSGHHGGIGGDQSFPFLIHPVDLTMDGDIVGAESMYQQLMKWRWNGKRGAGIR